MAINRRKGNTMDIKKLGKFARKHKKVLSVIAMMAMCVIMLAVGCFAEDTSTASSASALHLNFDMTELFSWAQMILDCLMPVLYVTLGVSLAFVIAGALKSAFGRY